MAPILKEADAPAATATTTATPVAKSPEAPARPQPVPLEIPVTVNGARTVEGSEKREPFAETTQTVLVFQHGAVIRIATPLAPGQLVFLTNEKTKKEVVCQVVKSKSGGSTNGYVELQFTEPAPAFWGLRLPGTVAAPPASSPAVPRPVATTPAPKVIPAAPPVAKIPAPSLIAPPVAQVSAPPQPAALPPAPPAVPVIKPASPVAPQSASPSVAPPVSIAPPPAVPKLPDPAPGHTIAPVATIPGVPLVSVPPPSPISSEPASASIHKVPSPLIPPPPAGPRDYSREIESLFAVPQASNSTTAKPVAPAVPPPPPVAPAPSSEELKLQAARLQEQLSSMLFTEAPPAATNLPSQLKLDTPAAEVASKILQIVQEAPKPVTESAAKADPAPELKPEIQPEHKPLAPVRTPAFSSLGARDEEVEIPSWLRPLSQHSAVVAETPLAASETANLVSSESAAGTATESSSVDFSTRSEAAVFGGQLLAGESAAEPTSASGSKKGLFFGLVAATLLAAGGAWYYRQTHTVAPTPQPAHTSSAPAVSELNSVTNTSAASTTPLRPPASASAPSNSTNSAPAPPQAAPAPAPAETRRSSESRNSAPPEEPAKKPSLGEVHLASPVVRGSGEGSVSGESLPSIETHAESSGADPLAGVAHHKAPAVPIPVGGDVKPAQLIKSVPPVYPPLAKTQRITGNVVLDSLIDVSGNVAQVKVISGPPLLHQAALDAVKQWKYTPAQLDGNPTSMHLTVTVQFRNQ